jgi:signal transduction histidine kinase
MVALHQRLRAVQSSLVRSDKAAGQLQRQVDLILDDMARIGTPVAADTRAMRLSQEIGTTRATDGIHPIESVRAAIEMFHVLLPLVYGELLIQGQDDALVTAANNLHSSIMRRVGIGAASYATHLLKKVNSSHRDERHRIARELHDHAAHAVGVALQDLQLHEVYVDRDPAKAMQKIASARQALDEALTLVRQTAQELRDSTSEHGGLDKALASYVESRVPADVEAVVEVAGDIEELPAEVSEELYLVLREAIRNAVRHSGARTLRVVVEVGEGTAHATVTDDGGGFDISKEVASPSGFGLLSMRERIELLDGDLTITSVEQKSTTVSISVSWVALIP